MGLAVSPHVCIPGFICVSVLDVDSYQHSLGQLFDASSRQWKSLSIFAINWYSFERPLTAGVFFAPFLSKTLLLLLFIRALKIGQELLSWVMFLTEESTQATFLFSFLQNNLKLWGFIHNSSFLNHVDKIQLLSTYSSENFSFSCDYCLKNAEIIILPGNPAGSKVKRVGHGSSTCKHIQNLFSSKDNTNRVEEVTC